jgi:phosphatidate cytidylyltransferase
MKQRLLTILVLAPIAVALVLLLPNAGFAVLCAIVGLVVLWEITRLLGLRSYLVRSLPLLVAAALMGLAWWSRDEAAWWALIGIGIAWWLAVLAWLRHFSFGAAPTAANRLLKLGAGRLTVLPAWAALVHLHGDRVDGPAWALFAVAIVWSADIFAYLAGRRFGRTRLAPRISPNKTRAGVAGAMIGAGVVAGLGAWLLDARGTVLVALVVLALVVVAASVVGDLFESLLKRQANVKDSGDLFPGHGGLFDRTDSLFAAMPVFVAGKALIDLVLGG